MIHTCVSPCMFLVAMETDWVTQEKLARAQIGGLGPIGGRKMADVKETVRS